MNVAGADRDWTGRLEPGGAVTGIGSLPIADPAEAIEFVQTRCPQLPFCPQAPSSDLVAVTLTQLDPTSEAAIRFELFAARALDGGFPDALALKTQVTGPVTLAHLLRVAGAVRTVDSALIAEMTDQVAGIATTQIRRLSPTGLPVLVYVDEPALALTDWPAFSAGTASIAQVVGSIESAGGIGGVHCCALSSPEPLAALGATVVSFDATAESANTTPDSWTFGHRSRLVSFGLIPTTGPPPSPGEAFSRWLIRASASGDPCELTRRTIVTATCGLGSVDVETARACFEACAGTAELISRVAHARLPSSAA